MRPECGRKGRRTGKRVTAARGGDAGRSCSSSSGGVGVMTVVHGTCTAWSGAAKPPKRGKSTSTEPHTHPYARTHCRSPARQPGSRATLIVAVVA